MVKFKLKLNQNELKSVGTCCLYCMQQVHHVRTLQGLISVETCERLYLRMRNMYRPDKNEYTLRLNTAEVDAVVNHVVPVMEFSEEPFFNIVGCGIGEDLRKQIDRELTIFNAMHHGQE